MTASESAHELGQPAAQELLKSAPLVRLAYNGPDGLPRVIPIGFHWNGERQVESMYAQMVRISIEPRWARFFDFGAGRIPSFLSKLASRD